MDIIDQAKAFAARAHQGQVRKGAAREPYIVHLEEVAALAIRFGADETVIAAAWLHDTIEDCAVTAHELRVIFGDEVTALVEELTDDKGLSAPERKRRQVLNAPRKSPGAALLKVCDKMSNVRAVAETPPLDWPLSRRAAYLDWAETVVAALPGVPHHARAAFGEALERARQALMEPPA
ncbi:HD domain-containing protein [Albidovulum sediminicola]|uniref:HD domain-containing protein n=1 Tax=Albidovulum sediminicola TaxID=2984331 RepID=A0ABT2Z0S2_9RHOB|nr:HD domain-containing protein [Defluviimonas sp. WL0075]MCV2864607.1 HD domain-containing protein [Defluviimonas sp. WL0075]